MNPKETTIGVVTLLIVVGVYLCQPEVIVKRQYSSLAEMEKVQQQIEKKFGHASITWSRPPLDIIIRLHGLHDETQKPGYRSPQVGVIYGFVLCFGLAGILHQRVSSRKNIEKGTPQPTL
jgi:hypothetical protein